MENNFYAQSSSSQDNPEEKSLSENNMLLWSLPTQNQPSNFLNMLEPEMDISNFVDNSMWPMGTPGSSSGATYPYEQLGNVFWMQPQVKQEWNQVSALASSCKQQDAMFPPTPPESAPIAFANETEGPKQIGFNPLLYPNKISREPTPPPSTSHSPHLQNFDTKRAIRRRSDETHKAAPRTYRRRASSHPSVASVVSLSAHEPETQFIDGIEHIRFLYSHERQVREYTVRTDVQSVNPNDISLDFRARNAIYPRANVEREEYDGNRWEYETNCNQLGWQLTWLNKSQLSGRRGLIQRAVDSYRNRHAEMRSRRVTRQEKVANGTLRKRRVKKSDHCTQ